MLAGAAKRQQHKTLWARVEELAAAPGSHTHQVILTDHVLEALDQQCQL
jgi:hypothetical protein